MIEPKKISLIKKTAALLMFLSFIVANACAADSNLKKIERLEYEKKGLSAKYDKMEKELSGVTMRIHEIDEELAGLRKSR